MMSALSVAFNCGSKQLIPFLTHLLNGYSCKHFFDFHIFSFQAFNHNFIIGLYIDFTRIAASNTAIRY